MRPSTRNALVVALGLAVASAELDSFAQPGALPGARPETDARDPAAARLAPVPERGLLAIPGGIARSGELVAAGTAGVDPASVTQDDDAAAPSSPRFIELYRESLIRRARDGRTAAADMSTADMPTADMEV